MKAFSLLLISVLSQSLYFSDVSAQIITILNESTREPIENIALYNSKQRYSTLSDINGKANITNFADSDSIFFNIHPLTHVLS